MANVGLRPGRNDGIFYVTIPTCRALIKENGGDEPGYFSELWVLVSGEGLENRAKKKVVERESLQSQLSMRLIIVIWN